MSRSSGPEPVNPGSPDEDGPAVGSGPGPRTPSAETEESDRGAANSGATDAAASSPAVGPSAAQSSGSGPPAHWLEYIARKAPYLLTRGGTVRPDEQPLAQARERHRASSADSSAAWRPDRGARADHRRDSRVFRSSIPAEAGPTDAAADAPRPDASCARSPEDRHGLAGARDVP